MHIGFLNPQGNFDAQDSFLTEHPDFGGQLVYVKEVCQALSAVGIHTDIITRRIDDPDWPGFAAQQDSFTSDRTGSRIIRIDCGGEKFLRKELLWPYLDEWTDNIIEFYGDDLPDAFTAHYADGGYAAALIKQKTGRGFTLTGHSLGAQKLDKLGMSTANADAMENEYHFSERIAAERIAMREAFRIITSTRQERMDQYGHSLYQGAVDVNDDEHFVVVPPGVNGTVFSTDRGPADEDTHADLAKRAAAGDQPYIIASSRLDEKKNILGIVRAYADSTELRQAARLGIFIRGMTDPFSEIGTLKPAEQAVLQPILDTIDQSGIRAQVDFFDIRSQQALASAYRYFAARGSVFALTAFYEPFGLAPIEAAACGLAVVATSNGGPTEIFEDGSGVLVDPFDTAAIAAGLLECLTRHDELAERGLHRVRTMYTWDKTAARYLEQALAIVGEGEKELRAPLEDINDRTRLNEYLAGSDRKTG